jgi:hypothetical protein
MTDVAAMAGISAAEREIVETVRVHILGMDETEFITATGDTIIVGGPDLVPGYFDGIAADMERRGDTYIPQLVDHGEGVEYSSRAVGKVREPELDDAGIWLIVDLWAEGVDARYGRDFVSAFWQFGSVGADGRPTTARIVECSFTSTPQFSLAQSPVSELETIEDGLFPIAATMKVPAQSPQAEPSMTIEEIMAALLANEDFAEAIRELVKVEDVAEEEAEEAEEAEPVEAADKSPEEGEDVAAMDGEHEDEEEAAEVAASVLKRLDDINDRLDRMERAKAVKAGLRGTKATTPTVPDVPAEFGARVLHFRNQGFDRANAVKAAQNYKGA